MNPALRRTFAILTVATACMAVLLAYLPAAGHDQLWILYVAHHVLAGERLYGPALLESNPPLTVWINLLPAWLANMTHLPAPAVGKALVVLLEGIIAALSLRGLRRLAPNFARSHATVLAFAFVTIFNVIPARDLGQKDHLLALLCLPYLLAAAAYASRIRVPVAEAILLGVLAAVGLALKPHQAVVAVAIEAWLIYRARTPRSLLRPEPLLLIAGATLYFEAVRHITPEYLNTVLPLLRDTYWAFGHLNPLEFLLEAFQLHLLALAAFAAWWWNKPNATVAPQPTLEPARLRSLTTALFIAGCAGTFAYYLQATGWYYQQLPAITFFSFALFTNASVRTKMLSAPVWLPTAAIALSVLAVVLTAWAMDYKLADLRTFPRTANDTPDTPNPAFFAGLPPGTAVATLTTTVDYTVMPAARFDLTIAQRYPHLWMLPAILRNETPGAGKPPGHIIPADRLEELDALQHQYMVEDLTRWRPALILVQRCHKASVHCQVLEDRDDDLLAWFLRDPAFTAIWREYTFAGHRGPFDAYSLREPAPAEQPAR